MAKLPEEVYEALKKENTIKIMATLDKEKVLNVVPIGSLYPISEEMLAFACCFPEGKTKANLSATRKVAIAIFEPPVDGYQVRGIFVKWHTSGEIFNQIAPGVSEKLQKLNKDLKVESVGTIRVSEVYALSLPVAGTKLA